MAASAHAKRARAACDERDWTEAVRNFAAAGDALDAADLERWGLAAFLVGADDESDAARERAHYAFMEAGDIDGALRVGHLLGVSLRVRGEVARAGGWFARLRTIIESRGLTDSVWQAYLDASDGMATLFSGQPDKAVEVFTRLRDVAARFDDAELQTLVYNGLGQSLVATGAVAEGLRHLDEVMVRATTAPDVSPQITGLMYCAVIDTCRRCFDVQRASEWTTALNRWCNEQQGLVPYRGQCLVHRSEVLQIHGAWADAFAEVDRVFALLDEHPRDAAAAMAHYQRGELHRLRGETQRAEECYIEAAHWGRDPQPGLALLRLQTGDTKGAWTALTRVVAEPEGSQHERVRLLPAYVTVALRVGDLAAAEAAARDLRAAADERASAYLDALASFAEAEVLAAGGDSAAALGALRVALGAWQSSAAAYDAARCRVAIGDACAALGDDATARLEWSAAAAVFAQLGARPDAAGVRRRLGDDPERATTSSPLTRRETEVLRLVATGATNRAIAQRLFLSEKTVARHVANIFTKLGVSTRAAATAWAFEHRAV